MVWLFSLDFFSFPVKLVLNVLLVGKSEQKETPVYRHVCSCNSIKYCRWRNVDISIKVCKARILISRDIYLKHNPCRHYEVKTSCMWNKQIAVGVEFFCYPILENCHSYYLHRKYFNFVTLGGSWGFETKEDTLCVFTMWNSLEDRALNPGLGSCSKLLTQTWFASSGLFKSGSMAVTDPYTSFLVYKQCFNLTFLKLCSALLQVKLHHLDPAR